MFLIIGIWGGERRVYSAFKFFLYTLLGSVLMLLAIITIYWQLGTTDIPTAMEKLNLPFIWQCWLFLAFFASFAVKVPMWPVHTWLPDAHVEAADRGIGHPGRRAAEDGRLRLPAALDPAIARSDAILRADDLRTVGGGRHLPPRWWRWCRRT